MHRIQSWHPNGLFAFGDHVVVVDRPQGDPTPPPQLEVFSALNPQNAPVEIPFVSAGFAIDMTPEEWDLRHAGGGAGMVRLRNGNLLLVTVAPGDDEPGPRYLATWEIASELDNSATPNDFRFLGLNELAIDPSWPSDSSHSENLSVLTECETGDIYVITMSVNKAPIIGRNFYALWRLENDPDGGTAPNPVPIDYQEFERDTGRCNLRAAGDVWAASDHTPVFLCHETHNALGQTVKFRAMTAW